MRVVVAAIGSLGDVAPLTRLAARFADRGHETTLVTHEAYAHLVPATVRTLPVSSDPNALMAGPAAWAIRRGSLRAINRTRHHFADFLHGAQAPTREALGGADVLVASTFAIAAVDEAMRQSIPVVRAHMWPEYDGLDGPMPLLPYSWNAPRGLRRLGRSALRRVEPYLGGVEGWWEQGRLHLVTRHPVGLTTTTAGSLYAFSPRLVDEPPRDGTVTGWWTDDGTPAGLSPEVQRSLAHGGDVIYAGFGSMAQRDPSRLLERLGAACERVGVRAIVQVGDVRGTPHPSLLCVGDEPHDELFRHVRVALHHGGAGTTGSAVRAGVPSVVVPHFADQFYWGGRLHALGLSPRPVPRPLVSERALTRSITAALSPELQRRASRMADAVRDEDGCGVAVQRVEEWIMGRP